MPTYNEDLVANKGATISGETTVDGNLVLSKPQFLLGLPPEKDGFTEPNQLVVNGKIISRGDLELVGTDLHSHLESGGLEYYFEPPNIYVAGSVGIGVSEASEKLHVYGDKILLENEDKKVFIRTDGDAVDLQSETHSLFVRSIGPGNHVILNPFIDDGYVGIGLEDPKAKLHVYGDKILLENEDKKVFIRTDGDAVDLQSETHSLFVRSTGPGNHVILNPFSGDGYVGIGLEDPKAKLHVQGDIIASGDIKLTNADCAEEFYVKDLCSSAPGTVMVIGDDGALHPSSDAYDKRVAGVISGAGGFSPGIILDSANQSMDRMPIALIGKVYCQVDADYAAIDIGDLLTTSPTKGHAMKALDPSKSFGSIIGKALDKYDRGKGLIPILVTLQ